MRKIPVLLLILALFSSAAAESLPLAPDFAETITVLYDEQDPSAGRYEYSYRYPRVDASSPCAVAVNSYYDYLVRDTRDYTVPNQADYYAGIGQDVTVNVDYEVTCSNDLYFSVRIRKTEEIDGEISETWEGNTFSLRDGMPGSVFSLPNILGILDAGESDEWLLERQAGRVCSVVFALVWNQIQKNAEDLPFRPELSRENLELLFDPELDFWLNEDGQPVFFIQPGYAASESAGLLTFPLTLEEIDDEL